MQEMA